MGANMAIRRDVWQRLGGCDVLLGAGARFRGGDDVDLAYRVAKLGYGVAHVPGYAIWHYGRREGTHATELACGYAEANGALYAKHARCGDRRAAAIIVRASTGYAWTVCSRLARRERPLGLRVLLAFLSGVV